MVEKIHVNNNEAAKILKKELEKLIKFCTWLENKGGVDAVKKEVQASDIETIFAGYQKMTLNPWISNGPLADFDEKFVGAFKKGIETSIENDKKAARKSVIDNIKTKYNQINTEFDELKERAEAFPADDGIQNTVVAANNLKKKFEDLLSKLEELPLDKNFDDKAFNKSVTEPFDAAVKDLSQKILDAENTARAARERAAQQQARSQSPEENPDEHIELGVQEKAQDAGRQTPPVGPNEPMEFSEIIPVILGAEYVEEDDGTALLDDSGKPLVYQHVKIVGNVDEAINKALTSQNNRSQLTEDDLIEKIDVLVFFGVDFTEANFGDKHGLELLDMIMKTVDETIISLLAEKKITDEQIKDLRPKLSDAQQKALAEFRNLKKQKEESNRFEM